MLPVDAVIVGQALETFGFEANGTIAGLGLMTAGFLWPCDGIWGSSDSLITTIWTLTTEPGNTVENCTD